MTSAPVAIVGAGPVGLALALGLACQGVRSILFEKKHEIDKRSKAVGVHVRTREVFRQWGIEERFLAAGELKRTLVVHNASPGRRPVFRMDFAELDDEADRAGILFLEQWQTEKLLLEAVQASALCDVRFGVEVIELAQSDRGVRLAVRENGRTRSLDAEYVVGCDGASSFVRGALGLPFDGLTYSARPLLADVRVDDERDTLAWPRMRNSARGFSFTFRLPTGLWRIVSFLRHPGAHGDEPSTEELEGCVQEVLGPGPFQTVWASRFRIHVRASPRFREGRVLLAGDAAHVHSPAGGFGMNGGIQDAHNLAWKLAYALDGADPRPLLDSYDTERRAVIVESVSRFTDFNTRTVLQAPAVFREGMFALWRAALRIRRLRRMGLRRMAMIDLDYPASPLAERNALSPGLRLPNPLLGTPQGTSARLYELLPYAAAILDVAGHRRFSADLPVEKIIRVGPGGHRDGADVLRRLLAGRDGWILVRPDAHVAWAGDDREGLDGALRRMLAR